MELFIYYAQVSNKWIIGIIVGIVAAGGFLLLNKSYSAPKPAAPTPVQTETQAPVSTQSAETSQQNVITLTRDGYSPATVTVKVNTAVTWVNNSGAAATVSSDPHPMHTNFPPLNLGKFSDGEKLSLTFDKPGTYGYHNHLDSSQTGTVIVQ